MSPGAGIEIEQQLRRLYVARVYPVLTHNDPVYQHSLVKAGLGWSAPEAVPASHRGSFEAEMGLQAWLGARRIEEARSLDPGTIFAKVLTGPLTLYRIADSATPPGRSGIWWFSEKVAKRCREAAGIDPRKQLDWLRNVLAVCFNWSRFDRIERLALHSGEEIPAVLGRGLPMPHYKVDPYVDRKTGEHLIKLPVDYWQQKGQDLLGGEMQIVLPWIPIRRVATTNSV
jgi:hypothetical protein